MAAMQNQQLLEAHREGTLVSAGRVVVPSCIAGANGCNVELTIVRRSSELDSFSFCFDLFGGIHACLL